MGTIKRRIILLIMQSWIYSWFMKHVIWRIRFTTYYTNFNGKKYKRGLSVLKAGDIILTTDSKKLTCLLIPGIVDHAALCLFDDTIAEMTHENFKYSDFFDVCKESTRVLIMRCYDWNDRYVEAVVEKCHSFEDAVYDNEFDLGVKALYCSELVYQSDFEHRLKVNLEDFAGIGREYISPMGLLFSSNCVCVFDSDNVFTGLNGSTIEKIVEG